MNKELVFKKEMRAFDINVDDIKPDEHIFGAIEEAIIKMRNECLIDRLEVVLNNNLIDIKDKITDNRIILGCRLSYADLSKDVSFIVRQDNEPTYEQLQKENKQLKEQLLVTQTNEETFRLEMKDITQTLGLDEDTLFDDVKVYVRSLKDNWNELKEYIDKTKIKEFEKSYGKRYGKTFNQAEIIVCNMILNKMQELQGSNSNE